MTVAVKAEFDVRLALRASRELRRRTPIITAQELNRQRRRSRTLLTREYSRKFGITPQKRIRKRILLPRGGLANRFKLEAIGLSLINTMPARWFANDPDPSIARPMGIVERRRVATKGKPFWATVRGEHRGLFRRKTPSKPRQFQKGQKPPPQLPIHSVTMDTAFAAYRIRALVLNQLAKEWPDIWNDRMRREIDRTFK